MIYVYFFYISSYFILGSVMGLLALSPFRVFRQLPFLMLSSYGFVHGFFDLVRMSQMVEMAGGPIVTHVLFDRLILVLLPLSFFLLLGFGVELLASNGRIRHGWRWSYLFMFLTFLVSVLLVSLKPIGPTWVTDFEGCSRFLIGAPACLVCSFALWRARAKALESPNTRYTKLIATAALLFVFYGLVLVIPNFHVSNPRYPEHLPSYMPFIIAMRAAVVIGLTGVLSYTLVVESAIVQTALQKMRAQIASLMAHDLRGMAAAIEGAAHLLSDSNISAQEQRLLEILKNRSRELRQLISDIFDMSLIDLGKISLTKTRVDLRRVVNETAQLLSSLCPHELKVDLPAQEVMVEADSFRIRQVVQNLISNACKYSKPGTPIEITIRKDFKQACVSVSNEGDYLSDEERLRCFDLYYRTQQAQRGQVGAGLGLFITKTLVEAHGGEVFAESHQRGVNVFGFKLPLLMARQAVTNSQTA